MAGIRIFSKNEKAKASANHLANKTQGKTSLLIETSNKPILRASNPPRSRTLDEAGPPWYLVITSFDGFNS